MKVSTKKDKDSPARVTNVSIIYDDAQAERGLATQALIVKAQGGWRKNGIPESIVLKMSEYAPGTRHSGPVDVKAAISVMSKEEKTALLKQLQEME